MALNDRVPPDPFRGEGIPDLGPFAANCYAMFVSFVGAGFREDQALRFTIDVTVSMLRVQPAPRGPDV